MSTGTPAAGEADLCSLGLAEGTAGGALQRVDVELDLLSEQPVDGAAQLEQLVHRRLALLGSEIGRDLVDEQAVEPRMSGLVDPVEAKDVPEQLVELGAVADVLDVVELGEPLDHARQQSAVRGEVPRTTPATASRPGTRPQLVPNPASN